MLATLAFVNPHLGASATKSVPAHLVGRAGLDLDATVDAYVPELPGYRGVPVRDVARLTSGVDWVEGTPTTARCRDLGYRTFPTIVERVAR